MRVACLTLGFVLVSSRPSLAQWTVAAYIGGAHTLPSDLHVSQPAAGIDLTFPEVTFRGESFESPLYYGYRVGRSIYHRKLFLEGEFIHAKVYAEFEDISGSGRLNGQSVSGVPGLAVVQHFAMSHGLNFILLNVALRQPIGGSRVAVVARGGAGPTLPHAETEIQGQSREGYQWAGLGLQGAGGVEISLWRGLHALIEYKFTRARPEVEVSGGEATVTTRSQHLAVGATWMFGS